MRIKPNSSSAPVLFGIIISCLMGIPALHAQVELPDLFVKGASVSTIYSSPGDYINVRIVLENQGNTPTSAIGNLEYYLSVDNQLERDTDLLIGTDQITTLNNGLNDEYYRFCRIPGDMPYGEYYLCINIDPENTIPESDEANNIYISSKPVLIVQDQAQEYEITFFDDFEKDLGWPNWDKEIISGNYGFERSDFEPKSGNWCLFSAGDAINGAHDIDSAGTDIVTSYHSSLKVISNDPLSNCDEAWFVFDCKSIDDPRGKHWLRTDYIDLTSSWSWFDEYRFDPATDLWNGWRQFQQPLKVNKRTEFTLSYACDEQKNKPGVYYDNVMILKYNPKPDLTCDQLDIIQTEASGWDTVNCVFNLSNLGKVMKTGVEYDLYLSEDTEFSEAEDYYLESFDLDTLYAQSQIVKELTTRIPVFMPEGEYYLCVVCDPRNLISELQEENNICMSSSPEIRINKEDDSWQVVYGDDFWTDFNTRWQNYSIQDKTKWTRGGSCASYNLNDQKFLISLDTFDLTDCTDAEIELTIWYCLQDYRPLHRWPADYPYIPSGKDYELDSLEVMIRNSQGQRTGLKLVGGASRYYLLSRTNHYDRFILSLKDWNGMNYIGTTDAQIIFKFNADGEKPDDWGSQVNLGYVIVRKKSDDSQPISLPDLKPEQLSTINTSVHQGQVIQSAMHVHNIGNAVSSSTTANFYLSTDTLYQSDQDSFLNSIEIPALAAGDSVPLDFGVNLMDDCADGDYYLIAVVDEDSVVQESDEMNNITHSVTSLHVEALQKMIVVTTHPCQAGFSVDDTAFSQTETFSWPVPSTHQLIADSLFQPNDSIRYVFDHWSDGGERSHSITVHDTMDTLSAYYRAEYWLNIASEYGEVTGAGWYAQGVTANFSCDSLVQEEQTRRLFSAWEGDFTGSACYGSVVMDQPKSIIALWNTQYPVDISIEPENGGTVLPIDIAEWLDSDSNITLTARANADSGYVFSGWQGDVTGAEPSVTVTVEGPVQLTALFELNPTAVASSNIPTEFSLSQNRPNPFNPTTRIAYDLPEPAHVRLEIYNMMGSRVRTLVNEMQESGRFQIMWNGCNAYGNRVSSGMYVTIIHAGDFQQRMKMILMK